MNGWGAGGVIARVLFGDSLASVAVGVSGGVCAPRSRVSRGSSSRWYTRSVPVQLPCVARASRFFFFSAPFPHPPWNHT